MIKTLFSMTLALGLTGGALAKTGTDVIVPLGEPAVLQHASCYVDTYDPAAGVYGGANIGGVPTFTTGNYMPKFTAPTGVGATLTDVAYKGSKKDEIINVSESFTCNNLELTTFAVVNIVNDVTIVVKGDFMMKSGSKLTVANGAKLTLYVEGEAEINEKSVLNPDSSRPGAVQFIKLGKSPLKVDNQAQLCGTVFATQSGLEVNNSAEFFGPMLAYTLRLENSGAAHLVHYDAPAPTTVEPLYD